MTDTPETKPLKAEHAERRRDTRLHGHREDAIGAITAAASDKEYRETEIRRDHGVHAYRDSQGRRNRHLATKAAANATDVLDLDAALHEYGIVIAGPAPFGARTRSPNGAFLSATLADIKAEHQPKTNGSQPHANGNGADDLEAAWTAYVAAQAKPAPVVDEGPVDAVDQYFTQDEQHRQTPDLVLAADEIAIHEATLDPQR